MGQVGLGQKKKKIPVGSTIQGLVTKLFYCGPYNFTTEDITILGPVSNKRTDHFLQD